MSVFLTVLAIAAGPPQAAQQDTKHPVNIEVSSGRVPPCNAGCRRRRHWRQYTRPYRSWLRSTRMCESGGNYRISTGNGFYGGYQFTLPSWGSVGGSGYPHQAPPLEQDYRAVRLLHAQGRGAWPVCG